MRPRGAVEVRERLGLSAQPAIRVIGKVVDAYTTQRRPLLMQSTTCVCCPSVITSM